MLDRIRLVAYLGSAPRP